MENKIAIGIRATPTAVYYCIIKDIDDGYHTLALDKVNVPVALKKPEQLKFIRNTFLDIISEYKVCYACVRIAESVAQTPNENRIGLEAVIQELFASSTVIDYFVGQISNISPKLGISRDEFKPLAEGKEVFNNIEGWKELSQPKRESILAVYSALTL